MDLQPIDIFKEIACLNFPEGEFLVAGSGIMAAKGIRPAYDLDLVVSENLFEICKGSGWELKPWTKPGIVGREWLKKGNVELLLHLGNMNQGFTLEVLLGEAEIVNGISFLSLERLMEFKALWGRTKDLDDIQLILKHLKFE
jgi:hypothetical protein